MHYPGYQESRTRVLGMDRRQLTDIVESLYGWSWGEDGLSEDLTHSVEVLRQEALRQHDQEWTIPTARESFFPDAE